MKCLMTIVLMIAAYSALSSGFDFIFTSEQYLFSWFFFGLKEPTSNKLRLLSSTTRHLYFLNITYGISYVTLIRSWEKRKKEKQETFEFFLDTFS